MSKILVNPDIHGRTFWKKPCENIDEYDKVIFLGDYLDPYNFEFVNVEDAIQNFKEIIEFKRNNMDKVVLLLGNHDMPYYSEDYLHFSSWHCRHSKLFHEQISDIFKTNKDLFKIAYVENSIMFTHAGIERGWLRNVVKCENSDPNEICNELNKLTDNVDGLSKLYRISDSRGGRDKYASCIWSDVNDIRWDSPHDADGDEKEFYEMKQVFGHTLQAYMDVDGKVKYGGAIEFSSCKMLDTTRAYVLDTDDFTITPLEK